MTKDRYTNVFAGLRSVVGARVRVIEYRGLGRSEWVGTVTHYNPDTLSITVDGIAVKKGDIAEVLI